MIKKSIPKRKSSEKPTPSFSVPISQLAAKKVTTSTLATGKMSEILKKAGVRKEVRVVTVASKSTDENMKSMLQNFGKMLRSETKAFRAAEKKHVAGMKREVKARAKA